jgi:hypothetical protein
MGELPNEIIPQTLMAATIFLCSQLGVPRVGTLTEHFLIDAAEVQRRTTQHLTFARPDERESALVIFLRLAEFALHSALITADSRAPVAITDSVSWFTGELVQRAVTT